MAESEIGRHGGTAQIEEPMGETQILVGDPLIHGERGNLGAVEHRERGDDDLDGSGCELWILRSFETRGHLATDRDHVFRAEGMGRGGGIGMEFGTENDLGDAVAIAQIDEDHAAMVASGGNPPAEGYIASDIGRAQGAAEAITVVHRKRRCLG